MRKQPPGTDPRGERSIAPYKFQCHVGNDCGQKHPPNRCEIFNTMSPAEGVDIIQARDLRERLHELARHTH